MMITDGVTLGWMLPVFWLVSGCLAFSQGQAPTARSPVTIAHVGAEPGRREARERAVEDVTRAWNIHSRESLQLIVVDCDGQGRAYKSELRQLFPQGVKHLPPSFAPRAPGTRIRR